ncbi:glycosyltransferase family 4 protein [Bacillus sp. 165]|uniref:glycosyltransferase family 4 protein n=1 Tax=Bacillus sp. 165 TaxID=1529117 RepID=UPI001AD9C116|nr:glycosyltransferase family 4 protein [Bacillus sp. 165]MBO9130027.1 glycosyltransferase family 4 protein [Bacillus sp. 165]
MHLGIVTHKVVKGDGQGRVNYEIVLAALEKGHRVTIVSTEIDNILLENNNVSWRKVDLGKTPTAFLRLLLFIIKSSSVLKKYGKEIDILVANGVTCWAKSDVNIVHFVHSEWLKSKVHPIKIRKDLSSLYQYLYNSLNSFAEKIALNRSKYIVAVSSKVKDEIINSVSIRNRDKIEIILNGVDETEFYSKDFNEGRVGALNRSLKALFVGDIKTNRKNLDTVLLAVKNIPKLELMVVGNLKGSPYPNMTKRLNIDDRVLFLGYRDDVANLMRQSDIFIFPSRYEPYGLVILEAMSTGTPVITSSICGASELVASSDNKCGYVVKDAENVKELIEYINSFIEKSELLVLYGRNASKVARVNNWDMMAKKYLDLFSRIYKEKGRY